MTPRLLVLASAALWLLSAASTLARPASADPADLTVGALRAPTARGGVPLREEPRMAAKVLGNVPHGTRFHVEALDGKWIRVSAKVVDGTTQVGWLKAADTVDPYALTGAGRTGAVGVGTGPRAGTGDVSAASRGFGPDIEERAVQSDAQLRAGLVYVDGIEATKPTPEEVSTFAKQGRLGIPGKTR